MLGRIALVSVAFAAGFACLADEPRKPSASRVADADQIRQRLGLSPAYDNVKGLDRVKVAVLDYGFAGIDGKRPYLPADAVLVEHYDPDFIKKFDLGAPDFKKGFEPGNAHGRQMAQLAWAAAGSSPKGPKFYLLNANGPTLFRRAVRYAIEQKVDVVLCSTVFEGAGNYDGRGPINKAVDEAVRAGILWVNAAGNFGKLVYNAPVRVRKDGFVRLGPQENGNRLHLRNLLDENAVTVTLTWSDYREDEDAGTRKDLDLIVEDGDGNVIGAGENVQIGPADKPGAGRSKNPRERVVLEDLAANPDRFYHIKVKARSDNFSPEDRLRILVTAVKPVAGADPKTGAAKPSLVLHEAPGIGEIYPPADHPRVITVGETAATSSVGPTADGRAKPDVVLASGSARFTNGDETGGSSNAAAYFAGIVAVLKAARPELTADHLLRYTAALRQAKVRAAEELPAPRPGPAPMTRPPVRVSIGRTGPTPYEWHLYLQVPWDDLPPVTPPAYRVPARSVIREEPVAKPTSTDRTWRTPTPTELAAIIRWAEATPPKTTTAKPATPLDRGSLPYRGP